MTIPDELLKTLLKVAVKECYERDYLLIEKSMEQASVARIFYYMQTLINSDEKFACFREYNLDCEYNKNGQHIKSTPRSKNGTRPDMILHERGTNNHNFLVVEFKSENGLRRTGNNDLIKLEDFTSQYIYNYQLGIFVKLFREKPEYVFFKKGKQILI
ncbi:MAG: hypothetical protein IKO95_00655 [Spirochaetia bacterium]|nr:hypothetical protein [Spirochaetia bacterium]